MEEFNIYKNNKNKCDFIEDMEKILSADFFRFKLEDIRTMETSMRLGAVLGCNATLDMIDIVLKTTFDKIPSLSSTGIGDVLREKTMEIMLETIPHKQILLNKNGLTCTNNYFQDAMRFAESIEGNSGEELDKKLNIILEEFDKLYKEINKKEEDTF